MTRKLLCSAIFLKLCYLLMPVAIADTALKDLQEIIENAKANDVILLEPGIYRGNVIIDKPLTLDGGGTATIDAMGKGSVIYLDTDGATIKNLRLTNSGALHNDIDAAIQVRGNFNVIKDNVIDNCLFGIDLQQSESNIVRRNTITSKPFDMGVRGDAVRLWYSFNNKILDNRIDNSRDMVVWYSADNVISGNHVTNSRYALHFMYARFNLVENNEYHENSVGIFLMYSDGVKLRNNTVTHATGPTGVGVGFKETSDILLENNRVLYCATGVYLDVSPYQPDTTNQFANNVIAYNNIGIRFLNDWKGNVFSKNHFHSNLNHVAVDGASTANRNTWQGNYWDDYQGFDRDQDNIGDTPYELYAYADRLWMDIPMAQFYQGSLVIELIDFLERLAPFTAPSLLLRDDKPIKKAATP